MIDKGSELFRLVYASRATLAVLARFEAATEEILTQAEANNSRLGVTGLLLAHQGWFLQVLEGPRRQIGQLFGAIVRDPRHVQIELLRAVPASERLFGDWAMSAPAMTPAAAAVARTLELQPDFDPTGMDMVQALALLAAIGRIPEVPGLKRAS